MNIMCVVLHQKHEKKSTKVSFWSVFIKDASFDAAR